MAETILHRLHEQGRTRPNAPAYYHKANGAWVATLWRDYVAQVRQAGRALIALGVEPGDIVCILGFNRPEWVIMDLAGMLVGGATAGIYTTNSAGEVQYITNHAEAKVILLEDEGQWEKIDQERDNLPHLKHIIMMKGTKIDNDPMALSWDEFMAKGDETDESEVDARLDALKMEDMATLIYTSGTTGPPKGVMLSHETLAWTAKQARFVFDLQPDDSTLSYLPLSHIAEQMFTIHAQATFGYQVYYAESGLKVADNLKEVQPSILFGVPRVWERFHDGVRARLAEATGARAKIAEWAQGVGHQVTGLRNQGQEPAGLLAIQYAIANKLFFSKVKEALGLSRAIYCVSGAAPIPPHILEFLAGLDLVVYEIYGQSEGCGPTTTNRPSMTKFGTVGPAWPGSEVRLGDDGEILMKGPNVFMGYYKNPEATAETLIDGWLHSGDLGKFDSDGYLSIVGRKKEIIITSGGKNIAPKNIEAALRKLDLVANAIIVGEQRRFLTALITLSPEAVEKFAQDNNIQGGNWHENPAIVAEIQRGIDEEVNREFARVEHVRGFRILPEDFSVEGGELTPTLKLKRAVIYNKYADTIETLYDS
ncbi:MAG TPA: long-chain fatty acid--CoA ligase [Anaerolineae bacterium]|nr:long-chain fatty acid--CoA ligase [Anaerolineae bacterium]